MIYRSNLVKFPLSEFVGQCQIDHWKLEQAWRNFVWQSTIYASPEIWSFLRNVSLFGISANKFKSYRVIALDLLVDTFFAFWSFESKDKMKGWRKNMLMLLVLLGFISSSPILALICGDSALDTALVIFIFPKDLPSYCTFFHSSFPFAHIYILLYVRRENNATMEILSMATDAALIVK